MKIFFFYFCLLPLIPLDDNDFIARWSFCNNYYNHSPGRIRISLEATQRVHGFGSLTRDRFKMDLYTSFAHCRGIACWKYFHLSHHFCLGVPWWPHGTLEMPRKILASLYDNFFNTVQTVSQTFDQALKEIIKNLKLNRLLSWCGNSNLQFLVPWRRQHCRSVGQDS